MLGKEDVFSGPSPGSFHANLYCAECWGGYWSHRGTNHGPNLEEEKKTVALYWWLGGKEELDLSRPRFSRLPNPHLSPPNYLAKKKKKKKAYQILHLPPGGSEYSTHPWWGRQLMDPKE